MDVRENSNIRGFYINNIFTQITNDGDTFYHSHSIYEIFYILNGEIDHVINNKTAHLKTGDMVILTPNDKHRFIRDKDNSCAHRDILISPELFADCCNFINPSLLHTIKSKNASHVWHLPIEKLSLLESEFNESTNQISSPINKFVGYDKLLCIEIIKQVAHKEIENSINNYPLWFNQLLSLFQSIEHLKSGLASILQTCPYNHAYVCRVFKKYTGYSMTEYLLQTRLQYASILLLSSNKIITEIVNEIGFYSVAYFNKEFKKKYNSTPSNFRKIHKENS